MNIYGSGRTDAGVHATGQVAHVDIITKEFEENRLMDAINAYLLDHKIKVTDVRKTIGDAHARFSALSREYEYVIINRAGRLVIDINRGWLINKNSNIPSCAFFTTWHIIGSPFTSSRGFPGKRSADILEGIKIIVFDINIFMRLTDANFF